MPRAAVRIRVRGKTIGKMRTKKIHLDGKSKTKGHLTDGRQVYKKGKLWYYSPR